MAMARQIEMLQIQSMNINKMAIMMSQQKQQPIPMHQQIMGQQSHQQSYPQPYPQRYPQPYQQPYHLPYQEPYQQCNDNCNGWIQNAWNTMPQLTNAATDQQSRENDGSGGGRQRTLFDRYEESNTMARAWKAAKSHEKERGMTAQTEKRNNNSSGQ